jgi:hypothetical protein
MRTIFTHKFPATDIIFMKTCKEIRQECVEAWAAVQAKYDHEIAEAVLPRVSSGGCRGEKIVILVK